MTGKRTNTTDLFQEKAITSSTPNRRLTLKRCFTSSDRDPLEEIEYERRNSRIVEPSGEVVFELKNLEVPKSWTQLATDILASLVLGLVSKGEEKQGLKFFLPLLIISLTNAKTIP